jgi:hypothetical protein
MTGAHIDTDTGDLGSGKGRSLFVSNFGRSDLFARLILCGLEPLMISDYTTYINSLHPFVF